MDDQQLWNLGAVRLTALQAALPVENSAALTKLLTRYRQTKEALAAEIAQVDAASVCRECRGQCCLNGKYRISVLDVLACLAAEVPVPANFDHKPLCPYGTDAGCTMEPGLRPADCILFICDAIDRKLSPQTGSIVAELERTLRESILTASHLTGEPLGTPLLLWAEKGSQFNAKV